MLFNNKKTFQQMYDKINKLNRSELYQMIDDFTKEGITGYAVLSIDTPNEKIPFNKRKYGCVTYSDAAKLYDKTVNRYNSLLEKE
ncbi:MAG: hypothetical protein NC489_33185 [Ruminococcus flavefaciens]|nr:hypothetical protein [Ruminococcus flavefaciens]